jgi:hypothetical protein
MSVTVWGTASKVGGIAAELSPSGTVIGGHSYDEISLELPDEGIVVDLDHAPGSEVGSVVYGEVSESGQVNLVGVVGGVDLDAAEEPIFFSPSLTMIGGSVGDGDISYIARIAELRSVALTLSPLTLGAQPVRWRAGDLRSSVDRAQWPISVGSSDPLLGRAIEHCSRELRHRSATRIVDRRPGDDYAVFGLRPGDRAPADLRSRTLPNGLRIGPPGRILSVR